MQREHHYAVTMTWTGNRGTGTSDYTAYSRNHEISGEGKAARIEGSSDPAFRGDPQRFNPEELLVAALSSCHMLAFLHLCADAKIVVVEYRDAAIGAMLQHGTTGEFTRVTLRPHVVITDPARLAELEMLHHQAHEQCFIARSVNFEVGCEATAAAA
ncbi:MAG: OsmC family protein [Acidobacteriota bacterium]